MYFNFPTQIINPRTLQGTTFSVEEITKIVSLF